MSRDCREARLEYQDPYKVQAARAELKSSIGSTLEENGIKCLLDTLGKEEAGVKINMSEGPMASSATAELVKARLSKNFKVVGDSQSRKS